MRTLSLLILACLSVGEAGAAEYMVVPGAGSSIVFESKATMESFEGKTDRVSGRAVFDPADLAAGFEAVLRVDAASFDTGIGLRNTHMRENHLHTDRFPMAEFRLLRLVHASRTALTEGDEVVLRMKGELELHGVTRSMTVDVTLRTRDNGAVEAVAQFPVSLEAHEIPRPKFLMLKLADEQLVRATIVARPSSGEQGQ